MTQFEGVVPALNEALTKRSYDTLTPVQKDVLAPELTDADLLVSAQTGSGKTVAFGMSLAPTLLDGADRLRPVKKPLALVVAPTRELALQVRRELEWLYEMTGASIASCVGGMDMRTERQVLGRGVHIVVGTPGRLRDHIERGSLDMTGLRAVVLDEADEMLDLGFREDLEYILDAAPPERRTLMFSATVPRQIVNLAKRYQNNAVRLTTSAEHIQHVDIEYRALTVAPSDRENAIINVLRYYEAQSAIVFCATRAGVNRMMSRFTNRGFSVVALSGELSQSERTHALQAMRDGRARVCIATDVAARGLDLPSLELVIHADLPENSQVMLHRSGRTGRAGRKGVSVLIVPHNQRKRAERLLQGGHIDATWAKPPSVREITERDDARLLDDPALTEPVTKDERTFVGEILSRHSPDQIAAAFVRLYRAGQSAPEDLRDHGPSDSGQKKDGKRKARVEFSDSVWFSLSVGHRENAEARWLLPMLYRAGNVATGEIGAIKIYNSETHVEIAPGSVDRFVEAIGADGEIEKNIAVTRIEGAPAPVEEKRGQPYAKRKRIERKRPGGNRKSNAARPQKTEPDWSPNESAGEATKDRSAYNKPSDQMTGEKADKPWGKKPKGKKPFRPKSGKPGGKPDGKPGGPKPHRKGRSANADGFSPRKRKAPKKSD